jgi:hypothetical protein
LSNKIRRDKEGGGVRLRLGLELGLGLDVLMRCLVICPLFCVSHYILIRLGPNVAGQMRVELRAEKPGYFFLVLDVAFDLFSSLSLFCPCFVLVLVLVLSLSLSLSLTLPLILFCLVVLVLVLALALVLALVLCLFELFPNILSCFQTPVFGAQRMVSNRIS